MLHLLHVLRGYARHCDPVSSSDSSIFFDRIPIASKTMAAFILSYGSLLGDPICFNTGPSSSSYAAFLKCNRVCMLNCNGSTYDEV